MVAGRILLWLLMCSSCATLTLVNVAFSPTTAGTVSNGTFTLLLSSGEQIGNAYWDATTKIVLTMPSAEIGVTGSALFNGLDALASWGTGMPATFDKVAHNLTVPIVAASVVKGPARLSWEITNLQLPNNCVDLGNWVISIGTLAVTGNPSGSSYRSGCNLPPVITGLSAVETPMNTAAAVPVLFINDTSSQTFLATLSAANGWLSFSEAVSYSTNANGVTLKGSLSTVLNPALKVLVYNPNPYFVGIDTVQLTVDDQDYYSPGGNMVTTVTFQVNVTADYAAPLISGPSLYVVEWGKRVLVNLSLAFPTDLQGLRMVTLTLSSSKGKLLTALSGRNVSYLSGSNASFSNMTVVTLPAAALLPKLQITYMPNPLYKTDCFVTVWDNVSVGLSDGIGIANFTTTVAILVPGAQDTCPNDDAVWAESYRPTTVMRGIKVNFEIFGLRASFYGNGFQVAFSRVADCSQGNWTTGGLPIAAQATLSPQVFSATFQLMELGTFFLCYKPNPDSQVLPNMDPTFWMVMASQTVVQAPPNCSAASAVMVAACTTCKLFNATSTAVLLSNNYALLQCQQDCLSDPLCLGISFGRTGTASTGNCYAVLQEQSVATPEASATYDSWVKANPDPTCNTPLQGVDSCSQYLTLNPQAPGAASTAACGCFMDVDGTPPAAYVNLSYPIGRSVGLNMSFYTDCCVGNTKLAVRTLPSSGIQWGVCPSF